MYKFILFLRSQPLLHIPLVVLYSMAVILPHEKVGVFIVGFIKHMPRAQMDKTVLGTGLILLALMGIPFVIKMLRHPDRVRILGYLLLTAGLVVLTYLLLFILPTEIAHFPQYALMAILLFPFSMRYGETLFWATLIGAIDEAYQYFYLSPERTLYYDWNDVVTDFLGAALGLIYLWAFLPGFLPKHRLAWKQSPALLTALGILTLGLILNLMGLLFVNPPPSETSQGIVLLEKAITGFWTPAKAPGITRFHLIHTLEGIVLLAGLFWVYGGLGRGKKSGTPG